MELLPPRVAPVRRRRERFCKLGSGADIKDSVTKGTSKAFQKFRTARMRSSSRGGRGAPRSSSNMFAEGRARQRRAARTQPDVPAPTMTISCVVVRVEIAAGIKENNAM